MVIYCTNDLLSAHTRKRCSYFEYYGINYDIIGISNFSNCDSLQKINSVYSTENNGLSRYLFRLYYALRIVLNLRKSKNAVIIFRGFEFLLWTSILKNKVYFEITDIPNVAFKNRILFRVFNLLFQKTSIITTSPAFLSLLKLETELIWHNVPFLNFYNKPELTKQNLNHRIIYAGYLRGLGTLKSEYQWIFHHSDFFGKRNIRNGSYDVLGQNYFGEYVFEDLQQIYSHYAFGFVSDFYGPNSNYNLTNRIYEVIFNECIPVHVKSDAVSEFFDNLGIFYISSKEHFEQVITLDVEKLMAITSSNYQKLKESVLKDFSILNLHFK